MRLAKSLAYRSCRHPTNCAQGCVCLSGGLNFRNGFPRKTNLQRHPAPGVHDSRGGVKPLVLREAAWAEDMVDRT
jgi:hypothetical protein